MTKPTEAMLAILLAIKFLQIQCGSPRQPFEPRVSRTSRCGKHEVYRSCEWVCANDCPRIVRHQHCQMMHCVSGCYCRPGKVRLDKGSYCIRPHLCIQHVNKTISDKSGKQGKPGKQNKPGKQGKSGKQGKPGKIIKPGKPAIPSERDQPNKLPNRDNPVKLHKPGKLHRPGKLQKPGKHGKPGKQGKPGKPQKPTKHGKPSKQNWHKWPWIQPRDEGFDIDYEEDTLDDVTEVPSTTFKSFLDDSFTYSKATLKLES